MVVMENRRWSNVKKLAFVCFDVIAMTGSILAAFWLRLGWPFHPRYILFLQTYIVPFIVIKIDIFYFSGMYRRLWRYASIRELRVIVQAVALSSLAILFLSYAVGTLPIPRTVFIVDGLLTLFAVGGIRFLGRTLSELRIYGQASATARRVLLVGAGDAGQMLAKEMLKTPALGYLPVGFIDDDPAKQGMGIHGVKGTGTGSRQKVLWESGRAEEATIPLPSVSRSVKEDVVNICKQAGVRCRTLPGIYERIDGRGGIGQIRDGQIGDILGGDPGTVDLRG